MSTSSAVFRLPRERDHTGVASSDNGDPSQRRARPGSRPIVDGDGYRVDLGLAAFDLGRDRDPERFSVDGHTLHVLGLTDLELHQPERALASLERALAIRSKGLGEG